MTRSKLAISVLSVTALAFSLTACGDDGNDSGGDSDTPGLFGDSNDDEGTADDGSGDAAADGDDAASDEADAEGEEAPAEDNGADEDDDEPLATRNPEDDLGDYCDLVQEVGDKYLNVEDMSLDDAKEAQNLLKDVALTSPEEMIGVWREFAELLIVVKDAEEAGPDALRDHPAAEDFQQVGQQIAEHVEDECGIS